ncbi:TPR repeat-containing protein [Syntrophus gentianae]|uniref:TPR repeat-containing protein n=1 Tax=Syntrophus gentianae TaxID=43775 RepID=A0A1H7WQS0_9BACT|nr:tetratricopeptide repeat protein [Syntrophus gentianae]SEM23783.1 TPR repeat-containing protein [Syntrophus gentianae]
MKHDNNEELFSMRSDRAGQRTKGIFSVPIGIWILWVFFCMTGCVAVNQEEADSHMNIGVAYMQTGKYNSALKEFLKAEELGESNPKLHYLLGIAYHRKGLNELAIEEMKKAVDLDTKYSEAYNYLGVIYIDLEKWDLAIECFEKALANILYDNPAMAHYNMGWAYYKKGNYPAALQQYELARAQKPEPVLMSFLEKNWGIVLLASGRSAEALKHLQKSIELMPSLAESYFWIGQCYVEQKNPEKAKAAFQEVIKLEPESEWSEKSRKKLDELSSRR